MEQEWPMSRFDKIEIVEQAVLFFSSNMFIVVKRQVSTTKCGQLTTKIGHFKCYPSGCQCQNKTYTIVVQTNSHTMK